MKLNELDLFESEEILDTNTKIKVFLLTQIGVDFRGTYELIDGKVHAQGDVTISHLRRKTLPFRFGKIKNGTLTIRNCSQLESLVGVPEEDNLSLKLIDLPNVKSLHELPAKMRQLELVGMKTLQSLEGIPKVDTLIVDNCNITSLKGIGPKWTMKNLILRNNSKLEDISDMPSKITARLDFRDRNDALKSMEGLSKNLKYVEEFYMDYKVRRGYLSLVQIEFGYNARALLRVHAKSFERLRIVCDYLGRPDDVFDCQAELIEAGCEEAATL